MRYLNKLLIVVLSFVISSHYLHACGWGADMDEYFSLFDQEVYQEPLYRPFLLTFHDLYDVYMSSNEDLLRLENNLNPKLENIQDWKTYFKGTLPDEKIEQLIYHSSLSNLASVRKKMESNERPGRNEESLDRFLMKSKNIALVEYLEFALTCEPHVDYYDPWYGPERDIESMSELIYDGEQKFRNCTDPFLKWRYAYQIVRLAHYSFQYQQGIDLYERFQLKQTDKYFIDDWCVSQVAGCYLKADQHSKAAYLYAQVFANSPGSRIGAFNSFYIEDDDNLEEMLKFCQSDEERIACWSMVALDAFNFSVDAFNEIANINPKEPILSLLLVREAKKMESAHFDNWSSNTWDLFELEPAEQSDLETLAQLASEMAAKQQTEDRALWNFVSGYLYFVMHKDELSRSQLDKVLEDESAPPMLFDYSNLIGHLLKLQPYENSLDPNFEKDVLSLIEWLENYEGVIDTRFVYDYIMMVVAKKMEADDRIVMMEMCLKQRTETWVYDWGYGDPTDSYYLPWDDERITRYLEFFERDEHTELEEFIADGFPLSRSDMIEMQGSALISSGDFTGAINKYREMEDGDYAYHFNLRADPFKVRIRDCRDCDFEDDYETINKMELCEEILRLKQAVRKEDDQQAWNYFLLGNIMYNLTYYGNNYEVTAYYREPGRDGDGRESEDYMEGFYDCSLAESYYLKAADASDDDEFKAQCVFMAAKCEQNMFYMEFGGEADSTTKNEFYRDHFKALKSGFRRTKFYSELIEECGYFGAFARRD